MSAGNKLKFIYKKTGTLTANEISTTYKDAIVFVESEKALYTHGVKYGVDSTTASKITDLESAVQALQQIKHFGGITVDGNTWVPATDGAALKVAGGGATTVSVETTTGTLTVSSTDYTNSINEAKKAGTDAMDAFTTYKDGDLKTTLEGLRTDVDAKVASVTSGSTAVKIGGTATAPTVGLTVDNSGNVQFSQTATGLKGTVTIPSATVTGVAASDKVLALTGTELTATVGISYDSTAKKIKLTGKNNTSLGEIDANDFIADGMLESVEWGTEGEEAGKLVFVWNATAGNKRMAIDLSKYIDTYTAGNGINIADHTVSVKLASGSEYTTVDANGLKVSGINTAISDAKSELIGTASDTAAADTIEGAKKYADGLAGNYATSAQGAKADTALQSISKGTDNSTYVTTNVSTKSNNTQTVSVNVTTQNVSTASASANGLAVAKDVKDYVDNSLTWEEL